MEDPLAEDILRGNFKGKDLIKITVKAEDEGNKHLYFEAVTTGNEGRASSSPRRRRTRRESEIVRS